MTAIEFALLSLVSLIVMVNPISIMPVFVTMTSNQSVAESRRFALKASVAALVVLLVFAFVGKMIFSLFAISVESLRIVGGILFFVVGHQMLTGSSDKELPAESAGPNSRIDQSITPVGVPLICGPGAISTVMLLMNQCDTIIHRAMLISVIIIVATVTFLSLVSARWLTSLIGETGISVLMRITGLIVMAVAVEFFIGGLTVIVPRVLGG